MTYEEFSKMLDKVFPYEEGFDIIIDCDEGGTVAEVYYGDSVRAKFSPDDEPTEEEMQKDKKCMLERFDFLLKNGAEKNLKKDFYDFPF